jgi:hypothetical protein
VTARLSFETPARLSMAALRPAVPLVAFKKCAAGGAPLIDGRGHPDLALWHQGASVAVPSFRLVRVRVAPPLLISALSSPLGIAAPLVLSLFDAISPISRYGVRDPRCWVKTSA